MFRRLRIINKGLVAILLPVAYLAILLGLLMERQREQIVAQEWVIHSKNVLLQVDGIFALLLESQNALRGYVLSDEPEAAQNAKDAVTRIPSAFQRLHDSIADNPSQMDRLRKVEDAFNTRLQWHQKMYEAIRDGHREAARESFAVREGQKLMDVVHQQIDIFRDREEEIDQERLTRLSTLTIEQRWLMITGFVLSIVIGAVAVAVFSQNITRRIAILIENAQRLASGEVLVPPMRGSDELNDLDHSFHEMAAKLKQARVKETALKNTLERRNGELTRANRDLDQKNQENEMFVYSVSHDLRSPLVNLQGFSRELGLVRGDLEMLVESEMDEARRQRARTIVQRDMPESIHFIQTAVTRLSSIIDALLRLSRAGRVEFRPEMVDVGAVIRRVVEAMRASITERKAEIVIGDLQSVWGDPTALDQVFANLIGNAVQYLDPARPGRIEIGMEHRDSKDLEGFQVYQVKDNGLGIAQAHLPKVFAIFQRLHPGTAPGEGVGLTLVRRMVERHGGRIWVESEAGVGSTFFVALPEKKHSPVGVAPRKESIRV